jgi:hypothetical protein
MSCGELLEVFQVSRQMPGQRVVGTDDIVFGRGDYDGY